MKKMFKKQKPAWKEKVVSTDAVLEKIEPGTNIFIGTGTAEPRTLVKALMTAESHRIEDLTLIQLLSFGDAISPEALESHRYRLKTFFSGWVSARAVTQGRADMIPSRFSIIPSLIKERQIPVDVSFVQITPPNKAGYCSLGVGVDVLVLVRAHVAPAISLALDHALYDTACAFGRKQRA